MSEIKYANAKMYKLVCKDVTINRTKNQKVIKEKNKIYNDEHKDKFIFERYPCLCGSDCTYIHKSRHDTSFKHLNFIISLYSNDMETSFNAIMELHNRNYSK